MNGWFIAFCIIQVLNLGMELAKHGEYKKPQKHNFWVQLISSAISFTIIYFAVKKGF
ncbi:MAG: hypothetical protein IKL65_00215 [Bacilli bacterium]|nr:hypothetical protein [Bacilli bacterium]